MATKKNEQYIDIPLKDIVADFAWNARSGDFKADTGGKEEEHNFGDLVKSMKQRGQDTPIVVRPKGKKFSLTAGFRRYAAMMQIAEETKNPNLTIKAVVKDQTEAAARAENIVENTARDDLKGPDLAWAVHQLFVLEQTGGNTLTDSAMAEMVGKSQPYISKLLRIMKGVTTKVTDAWRSSKIAVTVNDMNSLVSVAKGEQEAEFKRILESKGGAAGGQGAHSGNAWLDSAKKKAADIGTLLGRLEKQELIDTSGLAFDTHLDLCLKVNKKANARQRAQIAKAATKAYEDALAASDAPEATGDDSEE
jgi:ParB/RepB/Spo0J family partition protein